MVHRAHHIRIVQKIKGELTSLTIECLPTNNNNKHFILLPFIVYMVHRDRRTNANPLRLTYIYMEGRALEGTY